MFVPAVATASRYIPHLAKNTSCPGQRTSRAQQEAGLHLGLGNNTRACFQGDPAYDERDGHTNLTLVHEQFANIEARDHHNQEWAGCLVRIESFLIRQATGSLTHRS